MKTLSSCSRRLDRSSWLRYCLMAHGQRVLASYSLRRLPRQRRPLVRSALSLLYQARTIANVRVQLNSSSICMVGGLLTCGLTIAGTHSRRQLLRAGKRSRYRRMGCEVSVCIISFPFLFSYRSGCLLSKNRASARSNSLFIVS